MKALIGALAVIILMIGAQSAYAEHYGPGLLAYDEGFKVGMHDELKEGIYHHDKPDLHIPPWADGYYDGWSKACLDSGISGEDCGLVQDADTP